MSGAKLDDLHREWLKRPGYKAEYEKLAEAFGIASALIEARARAGLTQEEVAERMHTSQTVIARLESGRGKPSTRTLERFAEATGSRLRIVFEPAVGG
jgi:ribosome-binding protein aMBF1 (putative translation factor)